jgi:NAD(P)-dependent dehydrogenase (short-subunit alcohol dehydrogenase family)
MKVIVVGATGTIGKAVVAELGSRHEVIEVGHRGGRHQVDITRIDSVRALFRSIGKMDAVVSCAGKVHFGPLAEMSSDQFQIGLHDKLLGQVHLALAAQHHLNDGGSITLTSGVLSDDPIRFGAGASSVNAAIEGFVRGAAVELPRGMRINAVSPTILEESLGAFGAYFIGFEAVPAQRVALAYARSVDGARTGQIYKVW